MPPLSTGRNGVQATTEEHTGVEPASGTGRFRRRNLLSRVSIQSKLLDMLLFTSILSAAVVGFIGYQSGRSSLRAAVFDGLTEIRGSQARQLEGQFRDLENSLVVWSRGSTTADAIDAFTAGFDQLGSATINPAQQQSIADYYTDNFAKSEERQTGNKVDVATLLPGLHLDEAEDDFSTPDRMADALHGQVPERMTFLVKGHVRLIARGEDGVVVPIRTLEEGDFIGQTALTREPVVASAYALDEVTALQIDRDYIAELVERKSLLLQDIGRAIDDRRADVRRAISAAAG
jgi:hypothetical protein